MTNAERAPTIISISINPCPSLLCMRLECACEAFCWLLCHIIHSGSIDSQLAPVGNTLAYYFASRRQFPSIAKTGGGDALAVQKVMAIINKRFFSQHSARTVGQCSKEQPGGGCRPYDNNQFERKEFATSSDGDIYCSKLHTACRFFGIV